MEFGYGVWTPLAPSWTNLFLTRDGDYKRNDLVQLVGLLSTMHLGPCPVAPDSKNLLLQSFNHIGQSLGLCVVNGLGPTEENLNLDCPSPIACKSGLNQSMPSQSKAFACAIYLQIIGHCARVLPSKELFGCERVIHQK